MANTIDVFKKIGYTKGTFHEKMNTVKNRNGKDITEAGGIKKRWQEYRELFKKCLNDLDNQSSLITHKESDILDCEIKWALGSIIMKKKKKKERKKERKKLGGDRIPAELF